MNAFFEFKVGQFSCIALNDGSYHHAVETFFSDAERGRKLLAERGLPTTHIFIPYTLLAVDTGEHRVLIDTGFGRYGANIPPANPPMNDPTGSRIGQLLDNLPSAGIPISTVDTVILTHAHLDHIGGNLDADGRLNFPDAHYYIWKDEWDYWFSDERTANLNAWNVNFARENLEPLRERLTFVQHEAEVIPGISFLSLPGHTPGHSGIIIRSNEQSLIHACDAIVHPVHIEFPEMSLSVDTDPQQAVASKKRVCELAVSEQALVFAHHLPPFPSLGRIVQKGIGWLWQPLSP